MTGQATISAGSFPGSNAAGGGAAGGAVSGAGTTAIVGAGVVGAAVAYALAREGRPVLLIDRAEPGRGGASYGNIGHIASELQEPLPSPQLLFGFWRQLSLLGGPLQFSLPRLPGMVPWIARFARAAYRREENTKPLAPLVQAARATLAAWLEEIGRPEILKCNGHYEIWLGERAAAQAQEQAQAMARIGVRTELVSKEVVAASCAGMKRVDATSGAGLLFPESGHVIDPLEVVRAFANAARERGAQIHQATVRAIEPRDGGAGVRVVTAADTSSATRAALDDAQITAAIVCAGAWAAPLLEPFGLKVPMAAARGYHIEMPGQPLRLDAPVLYCDQNLIVTPMTGRLRASGFMEFTSPDAAPDPHKPRQLREKVRALGYQCDLDGPSWVGPRPALPDYLPGIGRVPGAANVFYAIGHQHIGLTLAAVTGDLLADLVAGRPPRFDTTAFDLRRFG